MADQDIINSEPIGSQLAKARKILIDACIGSCCLLSSEGLTRLSQKDTTPLVYIVNTIRCLPICERRSSKGGRGTLRDDLGRLISAICSDDFDFDRVQPLLDAVLDEKPDREIWAAVDTAVIEPTPPPPPRPLASVTQQTPSSGNSRSVVDSIEYSGETKHVLKKELRYFYPGVPSFCETYFRRVAGLEEASNFVFTKCTEGDDPLFRNDGWKEWPEHAQQNEVVEWLNEFNKRLMVIAEDYKSTPTDQRRPLTQPDKPLRGGSRAIRKLGYGFALVNSQDQNKDHWSQILIPGELKSNPAADEDPDTWRDLGKYAREVLAAQDTRRFVLGFTLCGSLMRVWAFDRIGGLSSTEFDINQEGKQLTYVLLAFLWMDKEDLGYDPTIVKEDGRQLVTIARNGKTERFVIDKLIMRTPCIAGRATTCWKAYREDDKQTPYVIKDSWQDTAWEEEGTLLKAAAESEVVTNVARYYHHETVHIHGQVDDVQKNVRGGLDTRKGSPLSKRSISSRASQSSGSASSRKRPSSQTGPPSKRIRTIDGSSVLPNREHRRVIVQDYGMPIYNADSRAALLKALEDCIKGHRSLIDAGILHRDISANNLMISKNSRSSFLIDLDLAIKIDRTSASGAEGKTGTRVFMAIGALQSEPHSYMHDLESFFWVLYWICILYNANGKEIGTGPEAKTKEERVKVNGIRAEMDRWNSMTDVELSTFKLGLINGDRNFLRHAEHLFSEHYRPLIPWVNKLRRVVFPSDIDWAKENPKLYDQMIDILDQAQKDPEVLATVSRAP